MLTSVKYIMVRNMRKYMFLSVLAFAVSMTASAQNADIEVSYVAHSPNFKNGKVDVTNRYVLLANASQSKFYSPVTEYIDSLNSTPEGVAKWKEMTRAAVMGGDFDKIPRKDGSYYVVKSLAGNSLRYYDSAGVDNYYYDETPDEWSWEISDSTKNILGYECVKASVVYHGRKWEVWFSPEIPLHNGPWKLGGLPGMILEASADGGKYSFVATGVQQTAKPIGAVYLADRYEKTDRRAFLKAKREFLDNPMGKINARFGGDIKVISNSDGPMFASAAVVDLIETDYK